MPTIETLRQASDKRKLVRKIQRAAAFLAPKTVQLPESLLTAPGTVVDLKTLGFLPLGLVTKDGYEFSREVKKSDINALGYASPVRSDIDEVPRSVKVTLLETGTKHVLELLFGQDLSGVTMDKTTGEFSFVETDLPRDAEYRLLVVGDDGPVLDNWIMGKGYGAVKMAASEAEKWSSDPYQHSITLDVFPDPELGGPVKHYFGGTGPLAAKTDLGFPEAP